MTLYLVNRSQSPDERRDKYMLLKDLGLSYHMRTRLRDWRWSKIKITLENMKLGTCVGSKKEYVAIKTKEEFEALQ